MAVIRKREAARRDLIDHFVYLADEAGLATAERFLTNAEMTFVDLLDLPLSGAPFVSARREFIGIRRWRVRDFENWLIFYLPDEKGISIVRVLHASSDWWSLLSYENN